MSSFHKRFSELETYLNDNSSWELFMEKFDVVWDEFSPSEEEPFLKEKFLSYFNSFSLSEERSRRVLVMLKGFYPLSIEDQLMNFLLPSIINLMEVQRRWTVWEAVNIRLIFDLLWHHPDILEKLSSSDRETALDVLAKIAHIPFNHEEESDIYMAVYFAVNVVGFDNPKYQPLFINHFDEGIREQAEEEYGL